jgi:hypothetical protein
MTSLLDARELTADELEAIADEPRPGVWIEEHEVFHNVGSTIQREGDGRALTQHETDLLIVRELWNDHAASTRPLQDAVAAWLRPPMVRLEADERSIRGVAHEQRGGTHSDPLVRLLAHRAWGDRDQRWFELRNRSLVFLDANGCVTGHPTSTRSKPIGRACSDPRADGTILVRVGPMTALNSADAGGSVSFMINESVVVFRVATAPG